jgi:hypothetical protein
MKIQKFIRNIQFNILSKLENYKHSLIDSLKVLKKGLAEESDETKEMLQIYFNYTKGNVSKDEMEKANEQFRDLLKALGLGVFVALPFAPVTIPFLVKLGEKLGVTILPSAFKKEKEPSK